MCWSDDDAGEETWEDQIELQQRFPFALAWGQANSQGEGVVSAPALPDELQEKDKSREDSRTNLPIRVRRSNTFVSGPDWAK